MQPKNTNEENFSVVVNLRTIINAELKTEAEARETNDGESGGDYATVHRKTAWRNIWESSDSVVSYSADHHHH